MMQFTKIRTKVIQQIDDPVAGFVWTYLMTMKDKDISRATLRKKLKMGIHKLSRTLDYLHERKLVDFVQNRDGIGQFSSVSIKVLDGGDFN